MKVAYSYSVLRYSMTRITRVCKHRRCGLLSRGQISPRPMHNKLRTHYKHVRKDRWSALSSNHSRYSGADSRSAVWTHPKHNRYFLGRTILPTTPGDTVKKCRFPPIGACNARRLSTRSPNSMTGDGESHPVGFMTRCFLPRDSTPPLRASSRSDVAQANRLCPWPGAGVMSSRLKWARTSHVLRGSIWRPFPRCR